MKSNDQLEVTVFVIFPGAGDLTWQKLDNLVKSRFRGIVHASTSSARTENQ